MRLLLGLALAAVLGSDARAGWLFDKSVHSEIVERIEIGPGDPVPFIAARDCDIDGLVPTQHRDYCRRVISSGMAEADWALRQGRRPFVDRGPVFDVLLSRLAVDLVHMGRLSGGYLSYRNSLYYLNELNGLSDDQKRALINALIRNYRGNEDVRAATLYRAFFDSRPWRLEVLRLLGSLGGPLATDILVREGLMTDDAAARQAALEGLRAMGTAAARKAIADALAIRERDAAAALEQVEAQRRSDLEDHGKRRQKIDETYTSEDSGLKQSYERSIRALDEQRRETEELRSTMRSKVRQALTAYRDTLEPSARAELDRLSEEQRSYRNDLPARSEALQKDREARKKRLIENLPKRLDELNKQRETLRELASALAEIDKQEAALRLAYPLELGKADRDYVVQQTDLAAEQAERAAEYSARRQQVTQRTESMKKSVEEILKALDGQSRVLGR